LLLVGQPPTLPEGCGLSEGHWRSSKLEDHRGLASGIEDERPPSRVDLAEIDPIEDRPGGRGVCQQRRVKRRGFRRGRQRKEQQREGGGGKPAHGNPLPECCVPNGRRVVGYALSTQAGANGRILNVLLLAAIGLTSNFLVALQLLAPWWMVFAIEAPLRQAFINGLIPSEQRATVLSFDSLMGSAGGVVAGPRSVEPRTSTGIRPRTWSRRRSRRWPCRSRFLPAARTPLRTRSGRSSRRDRQARLVRETGQPGSASVWIGVLGAILA
jgi:hypothetical protein